MDGLPNARVASALVLAGVIVAATDCGGRIALDAAPGADGGAPSDATAGDDAFDGDTRVAPLPSCTAEESQCLPDDGGVSTSAAVIDCDPVQFVGPWTLVLQRLDTHNQFQAVQQQSVLTPGFGAKFTDTKVPRTHLTYRVCVRDFTGTRCAPPISASPPTNCACEPFTCAQFTACNTTVDNGCGGRDVCGPCANNFACNPFDHSCCPPGQMSDGAFGCVCAPPRRCPPKTEWDVITCSCQSTC